MRILYLSLSYVPSRRASSVHVMKMCAALARKGHDVTLITKSCPERQESMVSDDFAFYGVEPTFQIRKLPRPARRGGGLIFIRELRRLLAGKEAGTFDLVYSRDLTGAWLAARRRHRVVFETHGLPTDPVSRHLERRLFRSPSFERLVAISAALVQLRSVRNLLPERDLVLVAHDAADDPGRGRIEPAGARRGGSEDSQTVGYVGHLYPGRGVELILELARRLESFQFHLIGGRSQDVERWSARDSPPNIRFLGFVPPAEVPEYCSGFDVLLMPYQRRVGVASGRTDTSAWMSPMKMFEYMAAGRPIVSSDLPVLREVLVHERNALLASPDLPAAWEKAIQRLAADPALARRLGLAARSDFLQHYTWDARAETVLAGL